MRVAILQPPYPYGVSSQTARACLDWMRERLRALRPGEQDLVLLPEYANAPGLENHAVLTSFAETEGARFTADLAAASQALGCLVAAGVVCRHGADWVNRAVLFGPAGEILAEYDKAHLTDVERLDLGLTAGSLPVVAEHGGVRLGFAVCFDLYFPEFFAALAARRADVILQPSYQRSESGERLRLLGGCRALDTGAYVLRAAYAMSNPEQGGHSLIAAPDGSVLADLGSVPGVLRGEFDPGARFTKPASHGRPPVEHRALIEAHRRPGLYRPAQERAARLLNTPFPWVCAHRGLSAACPENTLPAIGAGLACGAQEVECDLWLSGDGVPVVCHDPALDRTTNGTGRVQETEWSSIRQLDAGARFGAGWRGLTLPRLEEILDLVDGRALLNLHLKDPGPDGALVALARDLIRERGLVEMCYLAGDADMLRAARELAPEIPRACLAAQNQPDRQIEIAAEFGCRRIQFYRDATAAHCARAHALGLICNLFWSDDPADARAYVERGIDVILTNTAHRVTRAALV